MNLGTSLVLKATCRLLGIVNAIVLGLMFVFSAYATTRSVVAGIQIAVSGVIGFLIALFFIRCGECLAEIHHHFCRVEGLDRQPA
jgi:hypothetical protein